MLAIFVGILTIIIIGIIVSTISLLLTLSVSRTVSPEVYRAILAQPPYFMIFGFFRVITFISPFLAGIIVGRLVESKGWLYAGMMDLILTIISISTVLIALLFPSYMLINNPSFSTEVGIGLAQRNISSQLLQAPITILLASLGGWFGEFIYKKKR